MYAIYEQDQQLSLFESPEDSLDLNEKELRAYYETVSDAETRQTIDLLDKAFRQPMTNVLRRELNAIKREGLTNTELIARLKQLYHQHNMGEWRDRRKWEQEKPIATIICSQAFV